MRRSLIICLFLCSFAAFSCGPSVDEFNRISAENSRLREEVLALKQELEQCKTELENLKNSTVSARPLSSNGIEVLGKWKAAFTSSPNKYYTVEIIKEKGKYHSKLEFSDSDKVKIEQLKKDGDRYYVEGSKTKEYYRIIDGNLRLCDKDGDFTTGAGYKVTKIK